MENSPNEYLNPYILNAVKIYKKSLPPSGKILDVGCGKKPYAFVFETWEYVGIDVESSGRASKDKVPDKFFDGISIPFANDSFDGVLCTEVLEHCIDADALVSEIQRVLRPGGRALFTTPFIWGEHEAPYDFRRFSRFGLEKLLQKHSFLLVEQAIYCEGIPAIARLVDSEIHNFNKNWRPPSPSLAWRLLTKIAGLTWKFQLWIWTKTYHFRRLYIGNFAIVEKIRTSN